MPAPKFSGLSLSYLLESVYLAFAVFQGRQLRTDSNAEAVGASDIGLFCGQSIKVRIRTLIRNYSAGIEIWVSTAVIGVPVGNAYDCLTKFPPLLAILTI